MKRILVTGLFLAVVWTALVGSLTAAHLLLGFVLGVSISMLVPHLIRGDRHDEPGGARKRGFVRRAWAVLELILFVMWDLLMSSLRVAKDVIKPTHRMDSAVIAYPLDVKSDLELAVLANLLSMTPGRLTLDHDTEHRRLFIHIMHISNQDVDAEHDRLKRQMERRVQRVFGTL